MINLYESHITHILPEHFSQMASVQALGYAFGRVVQRLIDYCGNISVFAVIDNAPDYVLDMLALELGTQYYDDSLEIGVKRKLIRNTLVWYERAGTPAAVEELVISVFGKGEVQEWFQYGGEPYMFRICTNANANYESIEAFEKLIERVKNVRSHIEKVSFTREQELKEYLGIAGILQKRIKIGWEE